MFSLFGKGGAMEHLEVTKKTLRQFGLMVGGIFPLIGLWPCIWRQEPIRICIPRECSPVVTYVRGIEVLARNIFFSILL